MSALEQPGVASPALGAGAVGVDGQGKTQTLTAHPFEAGPDPYCARCGLPAENVRHGLVVTFVVIGLPAPQGSKRHVGRGIMVESSKRVKPWRQDVVTAAREAMLLGDGTQAEPLDGPLMASMVFTMPKPKSAPKTRRTWPDRTPDLSKLLRSTEDALTTAGVWADDARVVEYARAAKVFPFEDQAALDVPGARISVWQVRP